MLRTALLLLTLLYATASISQVGIGTVTPNAALDINDANSGILIPRIDLSSVTDATSVVNPQGGSLVDGTMVWNTGNGTLTTPGYYYWQNSMWNLVVSDSQKNVHIGKITISATGTITETGVGFTPSSIEFVAINRVQDYNDGAYRSASNNSNDIRMASGLTVGYATNYGGTISQQVIASGLSGSSINNIGTYSSTGHCIAAFFVNNNGEPLSDAGTNSGATTEEGLVRASLDTFDSDGFTLNVDRFIGAATGTRTNAIVVIYKAYR